MWIRPQLSTPATPHNDSHAHECHSGSDDVVGGESDPVDLPEPYQGHCHINTTIGRVDPAHGSGVERQEPDERGKAQCGW